MLAPETEAVRLDVVTGVETVAEVAAIVVEVVLVVVFNFLEVETDDPPPNEGEDFLAEDVLLTSGSSSSGSSWCFRLDLLFLAEPTSPPEEVEAAAAAAAEASTLRWCAGKEVSESVSDSDSTSSELLGLEGVFRCFFREPPEVVGAVVVAALLIAPALPLLS